MMMCCLDHSTQALEPLSAPSQRALPPPYGPLFYVTPLQVLGGAPGGFSILSNLVALRMGSM